MEWLVSLFSQWTEIELTAGRENWWNGKSGLWFFKHELLFFLFDSDLNIFWHWTIIQKEPSILKGSTQALVYIQHVMVQPHKKSPVLYFKYGFGEQ